MTKPALTVEMSPQQLAAERRLVAQARQDPHAFGKLFDRYYDAIFRYILHRTANAALAQELTSDTFYKALDKLWTFRWRGLPFSSWLYRIASNEVNAHYRRYRNYHTSSLDDDRDRLADDLSEADRELLAAEALLEEDVFFRELHRQIAALKPKYQEVITLRFFENKKLREIAEILGKSPGTVKSLLHRALAQLRDRLADKPEAAS
ncbi:MAG: sigma-70 family RNA polymerase sigma factor [Calditrichaeota bacterium]|nr:sigma-70 family RNA polymerase sigma factor [Calditrichota bacterium]